MRNIYIIILKILYFEVCGYMETKEVLEIALLSGEILLVSGAEVYRVEETIKRISDSYNVNCECFVMPTGIFVSSNGNGDGFVSYVRRIKERSMDLHKIELINSFSRKISEDPLGYDEAMKELEYIQNGPYFKFPLMLVAAGMTAFVYALLFKGTLFEALIAFVISVAIFAFQTKSKNAGFQFLQLLIAGMLAGGVSIGMKKIFPVLNIDKIIIGSIMILVPGVAITNSIKDALYGDIVSSLSRMGEAIFIATAVGIGVAIMLLFGTRWV